MTKQERIRQSLINASLLNVQELERQERARFNLAGLVQNTVPFALEPAQIKLCDLLQKIVFQSGQRIALKAPPQWSKTTIGAQRLPPFYLGHKPDARVRVLTYNEKHSTNAHGRVVQEVMKSDYYRRTFSNATGWVPDDAPRQEWFTPARAEKRDGQPSFAALGLQTGVIGGGSELYILDDPYASKTDAFSDAMNETMRGVWNENIYPRLSPTDNVLSLCHPWNERDFNAFLLSDAGFTEIRIPSICDSENDFAGRSYIPHAATISYKDYLGLHPDEQAELQATALTPRNPYEWLLKMRDGYTDENGSEVAGIGSAVFESLHQGNPKPRGGVTFQLQDFHTVDDYSHEPNAMIISYWDIGQSDSPESDFTSNWLIHKTFGGIYTFIEHDAFRLKKSERNRRIELTEASYREKYPTLNIRSFVELQFGVPDVTDEIIRTCGRFGMRADRVTQKKEERADPLVAQMQAGNVRFLKRVLTQAVRDEFLSFPRGKHDDRVDSASGAYNKAAFFRAA